MVTFVFCRNKTLYCHKFQSFDLVDKVHIQFTMCANTKLTGKHREPFNYRKSILTRGHKTIFSNRRTAIHASNLFLGNSTSWLIDRENCSSDHIFISYTNSSHIQTRVNIYHDDLFFLPWPFFFSRRKKKIDWERWIKCLL